MDTLVQYKDPILGHIQTCGAAAVKCQVFHRELLFEGRLLSDSLRVPPWHRIHSSFFLRFWVCFMCKRGRRYHQPTRAPGSLYQEMIIQRIFCFIGFQESLQLVVNCCFGAQWFGFLTSPYERDCYLGASLESPNHRAPNHQLTISRFNVLLILYLHLCL